MLTAVRRSLLSGTAGGRRRSGLVVGINNIDNNALLRSSCSNLHLTSSFTLQTCSRQLHNVSTRTVPQYTNITTHHANNANNNTRTALLFSTSANNKSNDCTSSVYYHSKAMDLLSSLPPPLSATQPGLDSWTEIQTYLHSLQHRKPLVIVLDDDPTGCQTVHNVNVLLEYNVPALMAQLNLCKPHANQGGIDPSLFYILTNTRALPESQAIQVIQEVLQCLDIALKEVFGDHIPPVHVVSRGDSTLRGHFRAEISTLAQHRCVQNNTTNTSMTTGYDGIIICPVFFDGGRITAHDIHYIQEPASAIIPTKAGHPAGPKVTPQTKVTPCAQSAFAKDPHFGFQSSHLQEYIVEKYGVVHQPTMVSVTLEDIRVGGLEAVKEKLRRVSKETFVVVNAVDEDDLNRFTLALLQVEQEDHKTFLARTAASYVASRCGIKPKPLLDYPDLLSTINTTRNVAEHTQKLSKGGIIVVGSYVPKTTSQLQHLLQHMDMESIEVPVATLIDSRRRSKNFDFDAYKIVDEVIAKIVQQMLSALAQDRHVVLFTSREFYPNATIAETAFVSHCITDIISQINYHQNKDNVVIHPAYIVSKGGITSQEVAQFSLGIEHAVVLGQIEAGIPVWKAQLTNDDDDDKEGKEKQEMLYIVFPGNVGDDTMLSQVAQKLGVSAKDTSSSSAVRKQKVYKSTSKEMLHTLQQAKHNQQAIAAFNIYNLEGAKAVVEAAEACRSPIILQIHPTPLRYGQEPLLRMLQSFQQQATVPVYLHLDHASEAVDIEYALSLDLFDSIMIDGSQKDFEENLIWTKKMAALAHEKGVLVEAELGKLAGEEDGLSVALKDSKMTNPEQVVRFVQETGVELLAVTIGNVHGKYAVQPPQLDLIRLQNIQQRLQTAKCHPYLVLHGASGLPSTLITQCIQHEIVKFNVNTDLRTSTLAYLKQELNHNPKVDLMDLMKGSTKVMKDVAVDKIKLFRPFSM